MIIMIQLGLKWHAGLPREIAIEVACGIATVRSGEKGNCSIGHVLVGGLVFRVCVVQIIKLYCACFGNRQY